MTCRFLLCFIAVSIASVSAISQELKEKGYMEVVLPHILACSNQFAVTGDKLKEAKDKGDAGGISPCFFSCLFKSMGVVDDQGQFNPEAAIEHSKKVLTEEADIKTFTEVANSCSAKVNNMNISDECERASLLFKCGVEKKALLFSQ